MSQSRQPIQAQPQVQAPAQAPERVRRTKPTTRFFQDLGPNAQSVPVGRRNIDLTANLNDEDAEYITAFLTKTLGKINQNAGDAVYVLRSGFYWFRGEGFILKNNLVAHRTSNANKPNKAHLTDAFSKFDLVDEYIGGGAFGDVYGCSATVKKALNSRFTATQKLFGKRRIVKVIWVDGVLVLVHKKVVNNVVIRDEIVRYPSAHEAAMNLLVPELHAKVLVSHTNFRYNPDITDVYDIFVSRRFEGEDITKVLSKHELSRAESLFACRNVFLAIQVAHRAGLVHRDVKPENLIMNVNDHFKVKLADYGLAKRIEWDTTGSKYGTPLYSSPEMRAGKNTSYNDSGVAFMRVAIELINGNTEIIDKLFPENWVGSIKFPSSDQRIMQAIIAAKNAEQLELTKSWLLNGKMFSCEEMLGDDNSDKQWNKTRADIYRLFLKINAVADERIEYDNIGIEWDAILQRYDERLVKAGRPKQMEPLLTAENPAIFVTPASDAAAPASSFRP